MSTSRLVEVAPERLAGWAERFAAAHGGVRTRVDGDAVHLDAADGTGAALAVPWPPLPDGGGPDGGGPDAVAALAAHAARPRTALLLLVRRGGFAVGTALDGALLDHATGTRYVQARTAAGGWSQQRYARRRSGQAAVLADAAAAAAVRVLGRAPTGPDVLVPGGDRLLVADVLADPGLADAGALPRAPLLDVPDPRLQVLAAAAGRARAVRVLVQDP